MTASFPLVRIFGTEIRAHWSWVFVLALISVVYSVDLANPAGAGWGPALAWTTAIATAVLVFVSVTIHELAHVAAARRDGIKTTSIVIQLVGGSFVLDARPSSAEAEFRLSVSGAIASVVLALLFGFVALFLTFGPMDMNVAPDGVQAIHFSAIMLTAFNLFMVVISVLPGYPLDGARILHAIVWWRSGDPVAAQAATVRVSRYVGYSLIVSGMVVAVTGDDWAPGLCMVVAGWLLMSSGRVLQRRAMLRGLLAGLHASDAVTSDFARIPPQLTLDVYAAEYLAERAGTAALVSRGDERLGLIGTTQIRRIPRGKWGDTHSEAAMVPMALVPTVAPEEDLWAALEILEKSGLDAMMIGATDGDPVLLTRRAAGKLLQEKVEAQRMAELALGTSRNRRFRGR